MYKINTKVIYLCNFYRNKLENFLAKRFDGKIEMREKSCYWPDVNIIWINKDHKGEEAVYAKWHEIGHAIWHKTGKIEFAPEAEIFTAFPVKTMGEIVEILDLLCLDYKLTLNGICPISDLLGILLNVNIPGYRSHKSGYGRDNISYTISNEWCANICAIIATKNYAAIQLIQKIAPNAFNFVLNLIEKTMQLPVI